MKNVSRGRVLVVEDVAPVRRLIARVLTARGYEVLEAEDGDAAVSLARESARPVDLVLADLSLPGMDGREVFARVRRLHPGARALFMSGYADGPEAGVVGPGAGFIGKPFAPEELTERIRLALSGASPAGRLGSA